MFTDLPIKDSPLRSTKGTLSTKINPKRSKIQRFLDKNQLNALKTPLTTDKDIQFSFQKVLASTHKSNLDKFFHNPFVTGDILIEVLENRNE